MTSRILLRVDANNRVGMGHAVRLSGLIDLMTTTAEFYVAGNDADRLAAAFPGRSVHALASDDEAGLRALLKTLAPDLLVADLPPSLPRPWSVLREAGVPIAALDDEGGELDADLVINGTVLDAYHRYRTPAAARLLCGTQYTLIRPVFAAHPWQGGASGVAIVAGSGERAEAWARLLASAAVDRRGWGEVSMVVGASCERYAELEAACRTAGISLYQAIPGETLANLLCRSAVALITGGMVVYETLAMGVPAVVFPQMPNLIPEAAWFAAHGAIVDLQYDGGMDPSAIERAVAQLLVDRQAARAMSAAQRQLVDGRGMQRAAAAVDALLGAGSAS